MYEDETDEDLRTVKALPLLHSFIAAVLAPIVIAIVFGIMGSKTNPLLLQIELLLVAISFCLVGILTRSKLRGLLSIISAPISWVILYFMDLFTNGLIFNPYGLFAGLSGPISAIVQTGILDQYVTNASELVTLITQIAIIIDLIIVEILAFFLGFFISTLSTGIWTKKGDLSILSIILKPFAAVFAILILIIVPFTYHGVATFADGGVSLGAGAAEFMGAFGEGLGGGTGSQIDSINFTALSEAAERAEYWFRRSSNAFEHVQGNFLIRAVLNALFPEGTSYGGLNLREIPAILDISDILAEVSSALPYLLAGYENLTNGFTITFAVLSTTSLGGGFGGSLEGFQAEYNETFVDGLNYIQDAIYKFREAEDAVNVSINKAKTIIDEVIVDKNQTEGFGVFAIIIEEADVGYGIILDVAQGGIDFLNATYKTALAIDDLGSSDFSGAHTWMSSAALDLSDANDTLKAIDSSGLSKGSPLPFWGTVQIITDMVELLNYFVRAAANATDCYTRIENVLDTLQELNFAEENVLTYDWNPLSSNVSTARTIFDGADNNIKLATSKSNELAAREEGYYGPIIEGSIGPVLDDFSSMLNQFSTNISEVANLLGALESTVFSIQSLTEGFSLFNQSYTDAHEAAAGNFLTFFSTFNGDPRTNRSKDLMQMAIENASTGYSAVDQTTVIPSDVTNTWKNVLHQPAPGPTVDPDPATVPPSIAGIAFGIYGLIGALQAAADLAEAEDNQGLIQNIFQKMENVTLSQIFSGGGGP